MPQPNFVSVMASHVALTDDAAVIHLPHSARASSRYLSSRAVLRRLGMHHTMADRSVTHFLDAYAHVTVAYARLTPRNAATCSTFA